MKRQLNLNKALRVLREFFWKNQRPPSYEEIRKLFSYKSKNAAFWLIRRLEEKGMVVRDDQGKIMLKTSGIAKVLGTVPAGFPSPSEEELCDTLDLNTFLVQSPNQTYLIRVTGDSMSEAGIHPGDLAVVERGRAPKLKDIVVAQVDGEWTIKYYDKQGKNVVLVPANSKYPKLYPRYELLMGGVVVGIIRKY